jgi:uncharacterized membrane protein
VTIRLLETIAVVAAQARGEAFREALRHHAALVHRGAREDIPEERDRADVDRRYREVLEVLESRPAPGFAEIQGG